MDEQLLVQLEQTLAHEIPICRAMSFEVVSWREDRLTMRMPLEPNKNHQYSAFAGSLTLRMETSSPLSSVITLSGGCASRLRIEDTAVARCASRCSSVSAGATLAAV